MRRQKPRNETLVVSADLFRAKGDAGAIEVLVYRHHKRTLFQVGRFNAENPDVQLFQRPLNVGEEFSQVLLLNKDILIIGHSGLLACLVEGKVGTFDRREFGTTYHLHFDTQVLTKYGWTFVNPYMTLVSAYERLIGARGQEIKEEPPPTPEPGMTAAALSEAVVAAQAAATAPLDIARAPIEHQHARLARGDDDRRIGKDTPRGIYDALKIANLPKSESISSNRSERERDRDARDRHGARAKHGVRALDRHVSAESHRTRRVGSDLHARHERGKARHHSLRARR